MKKGRLWDYAVIDWWLRNYAIEQVSVEVYERVVMQ